MSIRTVVVDDEKPARERIKRFLSEHPDFELVGEAGDGESAVRLINETRPDLVFLDVRMPEADGFEVLERCDPRPRVVFATAYARYADAHPGPARDTAGQAPRALSPSDRIPGKRGTRIHLLAPGEVLWFEADGELVFARAGAHRYLVSRTLAELEASLDPRTFFRSHRSFIVNLSAIGEIVPEESGNYRIIMRDAERTAVPLSRRQARKLRDVFPW